MLFPIIPRGKLYSWLPPEVQECIGMNGTTACVISGITHIIAHYFHNFHHQKLRTVCVSPSPLYRITGKIFSIDKNAACLKVWKP